MCAARLVPQRLKPQAMRSCHGAAEAAPLESRFLKHAIAIPAFARLVPQRLKPQAMRSCHGAAEAAPVQSRFLRYAIAIPAFAQVLSAPQER